MMNKESGLTNCGALEHLHIDKVIENEHAEKGAQGVKGFTNGAGKGFTNGAGQGFVNGARKGFVNGAGSGFTNGADNGFVNGAGRGIGEEHLQEGQNLRKLQKREPNAPKWWKKASAHEKFKPAMALIIVILMVSIIPQVAMQISHTIDKIKIDGLFKDWAEVPLYTDAIGDVDNQNIDIVSYGRLDQERCIYVYISGADELLVGNGTRHDTIILMMDTDGKRMTGYQANGLGYDNMITVSGYGGKIIFKSSFVYAGNGNNWNDWEKRGIPNVEMKDNQIEFKINCNDAVPMALDAYIVSADGEVEQIDGLLSTDYVGYRVYQYAIAEMCVGLGTTPVIYLSMICDANVTEISQITFTMSGTASDNSFGRFSLANDNNTEVGYGFVNDGVLKISTDITITQNQMANYTLSVNILENESADTFLFYIDSGYDFASGIVPKLYDIYKNYSYIGYIPIEVAIDGGFGEWYLEPEMSESGGIIEWDRLCILASDSYYGDNTYAMALKYYEAVVSGDIMPIVIANGTGDVGGEVGNTSSNATTTNETEAVRMIPEDPITGEDILIITIGSDRRVEIRGKDCKITKSVFAVLDGANWTETGSIESFCDERNLEFAITNVTVNENDVIRVISSNWNNDVYYYNHTHTVAFFEFNELTEEEPIEPLGTITQMSAYEHNATKTITIDGVFDDRAWADKSTCQYVVDLAYDIKVSVQRSATQLYVAVFAMGDTVESVEDACDIYFDTWNAGNTAYNNASYKRLRISGTGAITYYEGSAGGWALVTTPSGWTCADATTTYNAVAYRTYEFSVPLSGIDTQGRFGAVGETVGFSVLTLNYLSGINYRNMYYPDYLFTGADTHRTPNTWADLVYASDFVARDYALEVDATPDAMTIDGSLTESAWTNDATFTYVYDPHGVEIMELYYMRDATYLYVGLSLIGDTKYAGQDFAELLFDTDYDQTTLPDAGDKRIQITIANVTTYYEGNGAAWASATLPTNWLARSAYTGGESSYEFRMTLTELDENGNFGQDGDVIGFMAFAYRYEDNLNNRLAIYFPDGSQKYVSLITTRNFPSVYGELVLDIPELDVGLGAMGMLFVAIYIFRKKKEEMSEW